MDDNGGGYSKNGERSVLWTAQPDTDASKVTADGIMTNGKCAYIKAATYDGSTARAARGSSVRCVKE